MLRMCSVNCYVIANNIATPGYSQISLLYLIWPLKSPHTFSVLYLDTVSWMFTYLSVHSLRWVVPLMQVSTRVHKTLMFHSQNVKNSPLFISALWTWTGREEARIIMESRTKLTPGIWNFTHSSFLKNSHACRLRVCLIQAFYGMCVYKPEEISSKGLIFYVLPLTPFFLDFLTFWNF